MVGTRRSMVLILLLQYDSLVYCKFSYRQLSFSFAKKYFNITQYYLIECKVPEIKVAAVSPIGFRVSPGNTKWDGSVQMTPLLR